MSVYVYTCMGGLDQFCWVFRVNSHSLGDVDSLSAEQFLYVLLPGVTKIFT